MKKFLISLFSLVLLLSLSNCDVNLGTDDKKDDGETAAAGGSCSWTSSDGSLSMKLCQSIDNADFADKLEENCSGTYSENACNLDNLVGTCVYISNGINYTMQYGPDASDVMAKLSCDGLNGTYTSESSGSGQTSSVGCTITTTSTGNVMCQGYENATTELAASLQGSCVDGDAFTATYSASACNLTPLVGTCETTSNGNVVNTQYGYGYNVNTGGITMGEYMCNTSSGTWTGNNYF